MHDSHNLLNIDILAQKSKLNYLNPEYKIFIGICSLILCVSIKSFILMVVIGASMMFVTIYFGKLKLSAYFRLLSLPIVFLMLSGIAILIQISRTEIGIINIPFGHWYFSITRDSIGETGTVIIRSYCAITCLFMISLTTPIADIIGVLRKIKVPDIMIELMYLIYRYLMILIEVNAKMTIAANSRLGYKTFKSSYRSMFGIATNLLVLSFKRASISFDAMESRGYNGSIKFWQEKKELHRRELILGAVYFIVLGIIVIRYLRNI
jgi:cobalt/nickel transport system permease protein